MKRTKRLALLSEKEREFIDGNHNLEPKRRSGFFIELEKRVYGFLKDLELINKDSKGRLKPFKSRIIFELGYRPKNWIAGISLVDIFRHNLAHELYINEFRTFKKKKITYYWLNLVDESSVFKEKRTYYHMYHKAEEPNFLFRKIRVAKSNENWLKMEGSTLLEAYKKIKDLLPTSRENAISYSEIKKRLSDPQSYRKMIEQQNTMTLKEFKKKHPDEYKKMLTEEKIKQFRDREFARMKQKINKVIEKEIYKIISRQEKRFNQTIPQTQIDSLLQSLKSD